jgi:large subunit ribosomal protein L35
MKQKSRKTAEKRFKVTTTKKILRGHAYSSHLKTKKSGGRLRRQKEPQELTGGFKKKYKKILGV